MRKIINNDITCIIKNKSKKLLKLCKKYKLINKAILAKKPTIKEIKKFGINIKQKNNIVKKVISKYEKKPLSFEL